MPMVERHISMGKTPPETTEAQCGKPSRHSGETLTTSIFRISGPACHLRKKTFGGLTGGTEEIRALLIAVGEL
jgi:hypothetical protein